MNQERHKDDSIYVALFSKDFEGLCQTSLPAKMLFTIFLELVGFTSIVQNRERDGSPHKEPTRKTSTSSKFYNNRKFKKPDDKDNSSYKCKSVSQYLGLVHIE